jgi:hypothetical protein
MINPIKITLTTAGASTDTFSLFSDADGFVTPFATGVTKAQLLAGYISSVAPDFTSVVRIKSNSACMNSIDVFLPVIMLSTTSTSATWFSQNVINNGGVLTWKVYGDITPMVIVENRPTIDLSTNTGLVDMYIYDVCNLIRFDVYSMNPSEFITKLNVKGAILLEYLDVAPNAISELDLSNNINLNDVRVYNNNMSPTATDQIYIDLANGVGVNGWLEIRNNRTSASD